jgi:uncharacterized protein YdaU (DUF1376 family)
VPDDRIKRPAYQWNVQDARSDEVFLLMTYEQRGIYRELLDQQWLEGSIPADPSSLAKILRISPAKFQKVWPLISSKFRPRSDSRLVNDRLEVYRRGLDEFVKNQAEKGAIGAAKRWGSHAPAIATPMANDSTLTLTKTVTQEQERESAPPRTPARSETRTAAPLIAQSSHRNHAICGVVCLPSAMYEQFLGFCRHRPDPQGYVSAFFAQWNTRYFEGDRKAHEISGDAFDFWRKRWAETHPEVKKPAVDVAAMALENIKRDEARYGKR